MEGDPTQGRTFYPVEIGNEWTYAIDQIDYTPSGKTPSSYQLKEVIEDTIRLNDILYYRLFRYLRDDSSSMWEEDSVYTIHYIGDELIKTRVTTLYTALIFPVSEGAAWDGNRYNTSDAVMYQYLDAYSGKMMNGVEYPSTVTVIKENNVNLIETQLALEVYAQFVGSVYAKREFYETQPGQDTIGQFQEKTLISFELAP
jgi:hypothetical protein